MLSFLLFALTAAAAPTELFTRAATCGGDANLAQCGGAYPSDFCCPVASICVPLNVTGAIATICCPAGQDCRTVLPTTCDTRAYNATLVANNQVHASPVLPLASCATSCCPAGYECQGNSKCVAIATASSNTAIIVSTPSSSSTPTASGTALSASDSTPAAQPASSSFNGGSFAAGFIPGIVIGMLLLACVFWYLRRRRAVYNEKSHSTDQLTTLSPTGYPRLQSHMRSISEPVITNGGHRSDFLRSTPPHDESDRAASFNTIEEESSSSDHSHYEPRPLFEFSPSPVPQHSPLPAHLKRGTLSYSISPIRQLRTKKSLQSLRRHAASPLRGASQRQRSSLVRSNTSLSTETIQILMTPDQRPDYLDPAAAHDRSRTPVASSIYADRSTWATPSRQPTNPQPGMLGSPYSYRPQGAETQRARNKRVTTFSSLMERAGLRKEDLLPGPLR